MSYTQEQLTALKAAAAKGIKSVTTDGNTVIYASLDEMRRMIGIMESELAASSGSSRSRIVYPSFDRGI